MQDLRQDAESQRSNARRFVVLMLICLSAPPVLQALTELRNVGRIEAVHGLWNLATARLASAEFEQRLSADSALVRWARRFHAPTVDAVLDRGNSRVVFGRRNWLFYREAVNYVTGPSIVEGGTRRLATNSETDPLSVIVDFHQQLQAAGVELLVVPVPVKATLYPERLWAGADAFSLPNNPGFGDFVAELEEAGIGVLDLAPALLAAKRQGASLFLPRDTHWTPEAVVGSAGCRCGRSSRPQSSSSIIDMSPSRAAVISMACWPTLLGRHGSGRCVSSFHK